MKAPRPSSRRAFLEQLSIGTAAFAFSPGVRGQAATPAGGGQGRPLGIALVGLGGYSHGQLAPALRLTRDCRLTGVVTGSREKGLGWAEDFGFPGKNVYNYETMAGMADNPDIDIVYVVTPNALHPPHVIAAAWAGKHVICEKPMANTVADCNAMIAACRLNRVKLSLGYRLEFEPHHLEMVRLGRPAELGPFEKMSGGLAFTIRERVWRVEKAMAGGGPLMDIGIYCLHAACMATGETPTAVTAREHPKTRPDLFRDVEEGIDWTMEFAGGAKAEFMTSYNGRMDRFRAESVRGWLEIAPAFGYGGYRVTTSRGPLNLTAPPSQQALQMDDFARCVREDRPTRVPGEMGRRDLVIIEAIYASAAAGGRRVEVRD